MLWKKTSVNLKTAIETETERDFFLMRSKWSDLKVSNRLSNIYVISSRDNGGREKNIWINQVFQNIPKLFHISKMLKEPQEKKKEWKPYQGTQLPNYRKSIWRENLKIREKRKHELQITVINRTAFRKSVTIQKLWTTL